MHKYLIHDCIAEQSTLFISMGQKNDLLHCLPVNPILPRAIQTPEFLNTNLIERIKAEHDHRKCDPFWPFRKSVVKVKVIVIQTCFGF